MKRKSQKAIEYLIDNPYGNSDEVIIGMKNIIDYCDKEINEDG